MLHGDDAWERVRDAWEPLRAQTAATTPWQSWDFLSRWWRWHRGRRRLCLVVVADAAGPRLILPLQISRARTAASMRWLEPVGMPDDINQPRIGIGPPDRTAYRAALDGLWKLRWRWDGLRIDERTPGAPDVDAVVELAAGRGARVRWEPLHPCPYLSLDTDWPGYLASRSARLRKNLKAARRRLEGRGPWSLRRFESPAAVREGFALMVQVQARSWKAAPGVGLSHSDAYRRFYEELVVAMAARRAVRILVLHSGERPVAATIALTEGDTYHSSMIAHDAAFDDCSPGTMLEALELEGLMAEQRFRTYDFLGGAFNKRRWTDTALDTYRLVVLPPGPLTRVYESWVSGVGLRMRGAVERARATVASAFGGRVRLLSLTYACVAAL